MNFRREVARIAEGANVETAGWFQIMGQTPLRTVMEAALGLPSSIGQADIDKQKELFERKADQFFGGKSPAVFKDPLKIEDALRRFFLQTEINSGPSASTPGSAALTLLSGGGTGGGTSFAQNIFLSILR